MEPFIDDERDDHDCCWICPALRLPAGQFDVFERPTSETRFNPDDGFRYLPCGTPACVHAERVGLPPGRYGSRGEPLPDGITPSGSAG
ncbi:hypothetical protein [Streptomyces sp. CB03238]|uniref:hypothetical protein n=1 Tax=Streptomyces sp. CB03238 TaxID=1907777 RepID=UPI000A0FA7B4|nr:hypothetical protein [Streptomyces sp. CB03238]ORT61933.1 hypothetical protein BKD26_02690 [Streptomyces sp. CB03238]